MVQRLVWLLCIALPIAIAALPARSNASEHGREFWNALRQRHFKLEDPAKAGELAPEAVDFLSSPDGHWRDDVGYEALAAWIYRDEALDAAELESLRLRLLRLASIGLGESPGDRVFGRSFALLVLSVLAAEDLRRPFMNAQARNDVLDLALSALATERDLRGYVAGKGWAHATAHTADLLKFLARNPLLSVADRNRLVEGVIGRLRSAGLVFVWGEDIRLGEALRSVLERADVDPTPFQAWCDRLSVDSREVWSGPFDPPRYVALRAQLNAIAQMVARAPTATGGAGEGILNCLKDTLRKSD